MSWRAGARPDGGEVLEGLAHLEALDGQVAGVDEVIDPLPACSICSAVAGGGPRGCSILVQVGLSLGQLIGVVGKAQILAPRMDVYPAP